MSRRFFALLAVVSLTAGSIAAAGFQFSHENSTFKVGTGTTLKLSENIATWDGTLKNSGTISGGEEGYKITFANGIYDNNGVKSLLDVDLYPDASMTFSLASGETIEAASGTVLHNIVVGSATGEAARIEGQPYFSGSITLGSGKELELAISSKLNKNITFNADGTSVLTLIDDLRLEDGILLTDGTGAPRVDVNNQSLIFGAGADGNDLTITTSTTFYNAGDVVLTGKTVLQEEWVFNDNDCVLNGNGNILDMSHASAKITIPVNCTLHMNDVILKGLSGTKLNLEGRYDSSATSTLFMGNVSVHLEGNTSTHTGELRVEGPFTLYAQQYDWLISDASTDSAKLRIDNVTVYQDEGSQTAPGLVFGFQHYNYDSGDYLNSGTVREFASNSDIVDLQENIAVYKTGLSGLQTKHTLTANYYVEEENTWDIGTLIADLTLDGDGYFMEFNRNETNLLLVEGAYTLTFNDIVFKNFNTGAFSQGDGSEIIFGNNTTLVVDEKLSLGKTLTFDGTLTEIYANGNTIDLNTHGIGVLGTGTLKVYNARIENLQGTTSSLDGNNDIEAKNLYIASGATVELYDCEIVLSGNYTVDQATINLYENVAVKGSSILTVGGATSGVVALQANAKLLMDRGTTLKYDRDDSATAGLTVNATAKLHLNGCTFDVNSATLGYTLDAGTLIVEDKVTVSGGVSGTYPLKLDFYTLTLEILSGGVFNLTTGYVEYINTYEPV